MGVQNICLRMKLALALLALASYQVSGDGSFTGELACYGHLTTDVSTPEGGGYLERGQMSCNIIEWDGSSGLGPEAMFFKPQSGADFEIWAWDYHDWGNWPIPYAECEGDIWYKKGHGCWILHLHPCTLPPCLSLDQPGGGEELHWVWICQLCGDNHLLWMLSVFCSRNKLLKKKKKKKKKKKS